MRRPTMAAEGHRRYRDTPRAGRRGEGRRSHQNDLSGPDCQVDQVYGISEQHRLPCSITSRPVDTSTANQAGQGGSTANPPVISQKPPVVPAACPAGEAAGPLARISTQLIRPCSRILSRIARGVSGQVSRFGLARSHLLPLLRSPCHGIADRFRVLKSLPETRARIRPLSCSACLFALALCR